MKIFNSKKECVLYCVFVFLSFLFVRLTEDCRILFCMAGVTMLLFSVLLFIMRIIFIIIMNENVFKTKEYRSFIELLQRDNACKDKLYAPLINMNERFWKCFGMCYVSIVLFFFTAFIRIELGNFAIVYLFFVLDYFLNMMINVNGNLMKMVDNFEKEYIWEKEEK